MVKTSDITSRLAGEIDRTLKCVDRGVLELLGETYKRENNIRAKWALRQILDSDDIAARDGCYACQDTGIAMLFVTVGQDAQFDGTLEDALQEGVRRGYTNARKSIAHPLTRLNTQDNTPAVVYYDITRGDGLTIDFLAKGAGSENMSGVAMLTPGKGRQGIIDAVCDIVAKAGANPCPPIFLGVGIGGTMDKAAVLSKKALLRKAGESHPDGDIAALEREILDGVNALGIGVQGLGGENTALACGVEIAPTHIGSLPVAVTVQCHSVRHCRLVFSGERNEKN